MARQMALLTSPARQAVADEVGNGPSYGGVLRIAEGASLDDRQLDDGLLDVVVAERVGRGGRLRTCPRLCTGGDTRHPQYERHRVRTVTVAAPGVAGYAEGDRVGPLPLTVTAVPGALEVPVPDG